MILLQGTDLLSIMGRRYLGKSLSLQSRSAEAARYGRLHMCSNNYNIQKLLCSMLYRENATMYSALHGLLWNIICVLKTTDSVGMSSTSIKLFLIDSGRAMVV